MACCAMLSVVVAAVVVKRVWLSSGMLSYIPDRSQTPLTATAATTVCTSSIGQQAPKPDAVTGRKGGARANNEG